MRASALAVLIGALVASAAAAACKKAPPAPAPATLAPLPDVGEFLPPALDVPDYVGADACAECHREIYDAWKRSPHGRAMAVASPSTVLADFGTRPATLADGTVSFAHEGDAYFMNIASSRGSHEKRKVDLVLASGRQHQLYVTRTDDGGMKLLPVVWSTKTKEWLPLSLYQAGDLDPASPDYFGAQDMTKGCVSCHLSQSYRHVTADGARDAYVDLPVNCESCHGPGAEHVRRRRAGRTDDVYADLAPLGSVEESRVCGGCHGFQLKRYVFPRGPDGLPQIFVTSLLNPSLRADGTQHLTSYQYAGHVLSAGFREKILHCKDCHAPHGLEARAKDGSSAVGALSNKQCTTCHDELVAPARVTAHSHHSLATRCVDCHMSYSWIGDDDRRRQRTSDHSICVPHPAESVAFGTPNACTSCHDHEKQSPEWALQALRRWGAREALGVRDWVETIALARKKAPGAPARLAKLLTDRDTVAYLKASALDLLDVLPPDPMLIPVLVPYATDADPYLRASAIRALDAYDPAGRERWRALGLADAHPYVRMEAFTLVKDPRSLTPQAIDHELSDVLETMSPPTDGLVHLITVRHKRGELREAMQLVDLLDRIALPREKERLHLNDVRARIETDLSKADGGAP
ncbi:MAG TPA: multiheme c-type cytochrome [Polyangiaceae bacterium]|nr:multiheme c-type cytochrome [Polyangiaceae bacterium]